MSLRRRKLPIWIGGLGLFAVLIVGFIRIGSPEHLIHNDPRDFLLQESDMPAEGKYVVPLHERHVITNELVVYLLGDEAGERRIWRTGRMVGWRVHYVRGDCGAALPEDLTQMVTQYASAKGAQFNLNEYRLSTWFSNDGWQELESPFGLGDTALLETKSRSMADGSRVVWYSLSFTYRNMGVRLESMGKGGQVDLDSLNAMAKVVLARLAAVEPHHGPVPKPTPGFETPEEGWLIYR